MQRAVSTYLFVKERLHPGILDGLARGGVQAIEQMPEDLGLPDERRHAPLLRLVGVGVGDDESSLESDGAGQGSTFIVQLPVVEQQVVAAR